MCFLLVVLVKGDFYYYSYIYIYIYLNDNDEPFANGIVVRSVDCTDVLITEGAGRRNASQEEEHVRAETRDGGGHENVVDSDDEGNVDRRTHAGEKGTRCGEGNAGNSSRNACRRDCRAKEKERVHVVVVVTAFVVVHRISVRCCGPL